MKLLLLCLALVSTVYADAEVGTKKKLPSDCDTSGEKQKRTEVKRAVLHEKPPCMSKCALTQKVNDVDEQLLQFAMDFEKLSRDLAAKSSTEPVKESAEESQSDDYTTEEVESAPVVKSSSAAPNEDFILFDARLRRLEKSADTVDAMLGDLKLLKIQNSLLRSKTKASDNVARIVREQNAILIQQNAGLRQGYNTVQNMVEDLGNRLIQMEESTHALNNSMISLKEMGTVTSQRQSSRRNDDVMNELSEYSSKMRDMVIRMERVEEWIQQLLETGSAPPLMYQPTPHPQPDVPPRDCEEIRRMGFTTSGVYSIQPWAAKAPFEVYCEMDYYEGGWTLIQKRRDGTVSFDRLFNDYATGFGDLSGEHWLGNENIHLLTDQNSYRLHIVMLDWEGNRRYAEYAGFKLGSSREYYNLRFGAYTGDAGDGLRGNADDGSRNLYLSQFGTRDYDNDSCSPCMYEGQPFNNCAVLMRGGWWYRACSDSNLNGQYIQDHDLSACEGECFGIRWATWHNEINYSLKAVMMMVKTAPTDQ